MAQPEDSWARGMFLKIRPFLSPHFSSGAAQFGHSAEAAPSLSRVMEGELASPAQPLCSSHPHALPHSCSPMHAKSPSKHLLRISETETTRNLLQEEPKSRKQPSLPAEPREMGLSHPPSKHSMMPWADRLSYTVTAHGVLAGNS